MEAIFGLLIIAAAVAFFYRLGKDTGSRKGYGVGFRRGRSRRPR